MEHLSILYYDKDNIPVKLIPHNCNRCNERVAIAELPNVYLINACGDYFKELLIQLQSYGVSPLAVIRYTVEEEKKTYTVMKVTGNILNLPGMLQ